MRETRKQKIARQQEAAAGRAADVAFDPIRAALESGELIITPVPARDPFADRPEFKVIGEMWEAQAKNPRGCKILNA